MSYEYHIVDAFSDIAFGGVPVAVFPNAEKIPAAFLKPLSEEVVGSDSVFIHSDEERGRFSFQFFNAQGRCQSGAHTLIAGLAALNHRKVVADSNATNPIRIETTEDCIEAFVDQSAAHSPFLLKQQVIPVIDYFVPEKQQIADMLSLKTEDFADTKYSIVISSCAQPYLIVPLKSYNALREAVFNKEAWAGSSLPTSLVEKVLLFAPNTDRTGADFHLRLLQKDAAVGADPAIGETLPAFAAYICDQKHVQKGTHSLTVRRGANEERQSFLHLEIDNRGELPLSIRIGGAAVVTSSGEITPT